MLRLHCLTRGQVSNIELCADIEGLTVCHRLWPDLDVLQMRKVQIRQCRMSTFAPGLCGSVQCDQAECRGREMEEGDCRIGATMASVRLSGR